MTLNDAHIFVRPDQIKEEFIRVVRLVEAVYKDFGFENYSFRLSYRDPADTEKFQKPLPERCLHLQYGQGRNGRRFYGCHHVGIQTHFWRSQCRPGRIFQLLYAATHHCFCLIQVCLWKKFRHYGGTPV